MPGKTVVKNLKNPLPRKSRLLSVKKTFTLFCKSSAIIYALGTINKVKTVELVSPPITVIARGLQRFDPS
jgi:hypothetical protein